MSLLAVGLEAIVPSGESHAEASLIGQTFPVQPSVPASWDRVGYMRFPVKSFSMDYGTLFSSFGYLYCFMSMPVSCVWGLSVNMCVRTLMPEEDVGFLPLPHATYSLEAGSLTQPEACHFG